MLKSDDLILHKGIDVERYAASFPPEGLMTALKFIETFECDPVLAKALRHVMDEHKLWNFTTAKRIKPARKKYPAEPVFPTIRFGPCPKCDGTLFTGELRRCETKGTNRTAYKMCDSCVYYTETFFRDGQYQEMEGD